MQQAKILAVCLTLATAVQLDQVVARQQSTTSVTKIDTGKPGTVTKHTIGQTKDVVIPKPTPYPTKKLAQTES